MALAKLCKCQHTMSNHHVKSADNKNPPPIKIITHGECEVANCLCENYVHDVDVCARMVNYN